MKEPPIIASNFESSWNELVEKDDNLRLLIEDLLDALYAIDYMEDDSAQELEHLAVMQISRALQNMGLSLDKLGGDFFIWNLVQCLDPKSVEQWGLFLGSSKDAPTWDQLTNF